MRHTPTWRGRLLLLKYSGSTLLMATSQPQKHLRPPFCHLPQLVSNLTFSHFHFLQIVSKFLLPGATGVPEKREPAMSQVGGYKAWHMSQKCLKNYSETSLKCRRMSQSIPKMCQKCVRNRSKLVVSQAGEYKPWQMRNLLKSDFQLSFVTH